MSLRLEVVGRCRGSIGDHRIGPTSHLVFAAALYLGLKAGNAVPRMVLAEVLWPRAANRERASRLRWLLSKLRRLGLQIDADDVEVRLPGHAAVTDFDDLEALEISEVGSILKGYAPSFSPAFGEWVDAQRERIGYDVILQLSARLRAAAAAHEWDRVVEIASGIRRIDALHELTVLALADAYYQLGATNLALQCLENFVGEVAIPARAVAARELAKRIRNGVGVGTTPADALFVGRESQLRRIAALLHGAADGRGGALVLAGVAGIGKTRLLQESARRATLLGMQVVSTRYQSGDSSGPLSGLTELATQLMALRGAAGADPQTLERLGSLVRASGNPMRGRPAEESSELAPHNLRAALVDVLDAVSEEAPIALVLDDVQWADPASIDYFQDLVSSAATRRVAWLFAARRVDPDTVPLRAPTLVIPSLASNEGAALLTHLAGRAGLSVDAANRAAILERGGGSPLFLRELFRVWAKTRSIAELPPSLSSLFETTLGHLGANALHCLQASALLGKHATIDRIERVLQMGRSDFLAAVAELDQAGILTTDADGTLTGHVLWADAALAQLSSSPMRTLHRHAAEQFELELAANPSPTWIWESVRHWEAAGYLERARSSARKGAEHLADNGLLAEAADAYAIVLESPMAPQERLRLLRRRIDLLFRANRLSDVVHDIDSHEGLASELDPAYETHNDLELLRRTTIHAVVGPFPENAQKTVPGQAIMLQSLSCLRDSKASTAHRLGAAKQCAFMADSISLGIISEVWATASQLTPTGRADARDKLRIAILYEMSTGDLRKAVELAEHGRIVEAQHPASRELVIATVFCAQCYRLVGRVADARAACIEAVETSTRHGLFESLIFAYDRMIATAVDIDPPDVTGRLLREVRDAVALIDPEGRSLFTRLSLPSYEAQVAVEEGRTVDALRLAPAIETCLNCPPRRLRARFLAIHLGARLTLLPATELSKLATALAACFEAPEYWLDWPAIMFSRYLEQAHGRPAAADFARHFLRDIRRELSSPPEPLARLAAGDNERQQDMFATQPSGDESALFDRYRLARLGVATSDEGVEVLGGPAPGLIDPL